MSTTVVVNGLNYFIPAVGENNWGQNVTDALVALATAASSNASVFNRVTVTSTPITVVSGRTYLVDTTVARTLNLPTPANNAYLIVKDVTGTAKTNNISIHRAAAEKINGTAADFTCTVNSGHWIFISDGTDWFVIKDPDITPYVQLNLTNSVVNADIASAAAIVYSKLTLSASIVNADIATAAAIAYSKLTLTGSVVNADINGSAAIAMSKLAAVTANRAITSDASGVLVGNPGATTDTEIGYVHGVTSAIQTQIAGLLSLGGGTLTGVLLTTAGTVAAPPIAFSVETGSGFYRIGTGNIGASVQGTQIFRFNSNGIIVNTGNLLFNSTSTNGILGSTTNDNAAAGNVGEAVRSAVTTATNFPASTTYGDLTSISLTAGDWDVTVVVGGFSNGTTTFTQMRIGVGTVSGNTTPAAEGDSYVITPGSTTCDVSACIPSYRMSLSGTTTVYLKYRADSTGTVPQAVGRISARRIR